VGGDGGDAEDFVTGDGAGLGGREAIGYGLAVARWRDAGDSAGETAGGGAEGEGDLFGADADGVVGAAGAGFGDEELVAVAEGEASGVIEVGCVGLGLEGQGG
jgi:hypothetical protein